MLAVSLGLNFALFLIKKWEHVAQSHLTGRLTDSEIELLSMKCCSNELVAFKFCGVFANWPPS